MSRLTRMLVVATALVAASINACAPDPSEGVPNAVVSGEDSNDALEQPAEPAEAEPEGSLVEPIDEAEPLAPPNAIPLTGSIAFIGSKVTRTHECLFHTWQGTLDPGQGTPETASLAFTVQADSLECDPDESGAMHDRFHEHLHSDDFLGVEQHPEAIFRSTSITPDTVTPGTYSIEGDLTIRGITNAISFPAQVVVGEGVVSATAEFSLNRRDWGLIYDGKPDDLIRDAFVMQIALEGVQ